ncbi:hypothetical protein X970_15295 [Pseudomonas monteilii SB3101]|uniref:Uncharacterized protein n=1 Tax=Pseudomonas monteilii SB3101 TaxID=1435058 RepID=V9VB47_9PSED|nr:hypothetical protein X969_15650 [Pseudomonas monteilii SB3078]AHC91130.1 hypothetical protein X970_15295 [Pseudomonas monteilii SB3101]
MFQAKKPESWRDPVGAALCRERAAQQPQGFSADAQIAGAALQPFRDTRPLLQDLCMP